MPRGSRVPDVRGRWPGIGRWVATWVGRLAAGEHVVAMMTTVRGASNAKAKRELDWTPHDASWRQGFRTLAG